jgi:hypothetical protein
MNARDRSRWLEPSPPLPVDGEELPAERPASPSPRDPGERGVRSSAGEPGQAAWEPTAG